MEYAIEIKDVTKNYENFTLDHIQLNVPKGCIMGLIGENGAGKSTLIKSILNLIKNDGGEVKIYGKTMGIEEVETKEWIGVVFDESYFHDYLMVKDIKKIMKRIYKQWDDACFEHYVEVFGLPEQKRIKTFSRGMKMKLSMAVALSHHAKLLILDEATSGLDPVVRDEILDIFLEFIQDEEHTILVSSHITSDLDKIADYITFLHEGKIIFCKEKDELLNQYGILRCGEEDYQKLDQKHVIGVRKNHFGYEVMVDNRPEMEEIWGPDHVDATSIEEIMLFLIKGGKDL